MSSLAEPLIAVSDMLGPSDVVAEHMTVPATTAPPSAAPSSRPLASRAQRRLLYLSYAFASFGDRAWEFASLVFIVELFPSTLLYASVFGVIETVAGLLAGPYIGAWIDRNQRLPVIRVSVIGQNAVMVVASIVFYIALQASRSDLVLLYLAYSALTICACLIKISSSLNKISLHKDWTPCVAADDRTVLSEMNAAMRRVDLTNSIVVPLVVGVLSSLTSSSTAIATLGIWSTVSLVIEIQLCAHVCRVGRQLIGCIFFPS
jgi:solute carrier family 40 (iron-regulated transporter), member 1